RGSAALPQAGLSLLACPKPSPWSHGPARQERPKRWQVLQSLPHDYPRLPPLPTLRSPPQQTAARAVPSFLRPTTKTPTYVLPFSGRRPHLGGGTWSNRLRKRSDGHFGTGDSRDG